ncbi:MAG: hypothetical protein GY868_14855 [Deltaproteobacteria bacterium]|nr:hypothetical protein [Deltaproteobacteria bacterium]
MEILFIIVLIAALVYTGLWKMILPIVVLLLIAFIISETKPKTQTAKSHKAANPAPLPRPVSIGPVQNV